MDALNFKHIKLNSPVTKSTPSVFPVLVNSFPPKHPSQNSQDSLLLTPFPLQHTDNGGTTQKSPSNLFPSLSLLPGVLKQLF